MSAIPSISTLIQLITIKLSPSNYIQWRNQLVAILVSHDLLGFVDGSSCESPADAIWYLKDQNVLNLIFSSLTPQCCAEVAQHKSFSSSRALWLALETAFTHPSPKGGLFLKNDGDGRKNHSSTEFDGGRAVSLDDDAVTEILVRLPAKSLIGCRRVRKSWLSVISTVHFRRRHILRRLHSPQHQQQLLLVTRYLRSPLITKETASLLVFNPTSIKGRATHLDIVDINNSEILNASNGLFLLKFQHDNGYYVHNPTTNKSRKVVLAYHQDDSYIQVVSLHLLFDPSKSLDYRIICVRVKPPIKSYLIEVFDSKSRTWRVCVEPFTSGESMNFGDCVQCNNSVYLIGFGSGNGRVFCFDIDKNHVSKLYVIPEPQRARLHSLQESNGRLYYSALLEQNLAAVWELQVQVQVKGEDPARISQWLLKYHQRVDRLPHMWEGNLLRFITGTSTMLIHIPGKIVAYSFLDKSHRDIVDLKTQAYASVLRFGEHKAYANVYQFGETLALL